MEYWWLKSMSQLRGSFAIADEGGVVNSSSATGFDTISFVVAGRDTHFDLSHRIRRFCLRYGALVSLFLCCSLSSWFCLSLKLVPF